MKYLSKKFAIIDLGSNSVRMIIMQIFEDGTYKMIDQVKEMVRLSEGMGEDNILKPKPIERTVYTLKLFKKLIKSYEIKDIYCVATAAVRVASNKDDFLQKVKDETGFKFDVITGKQEAYYDYLGVINSIDINDCLIVDIGGASTEMVLVKNRQPQEIISFPFGAVLLTDKFLSHKDISKKELNGLESFLVEEFNSIKWLKKLKGIPIVGLGGTIRTIAKIDKHKIKFPLQSLHNYQINKEEVFYAYDKLSNTKLKDRKRIKGVGKERADIIVGGLAPIKCLIELIDCNKFIISGNGLREGVFYENYMKERGSKNLVIDDVLEHSIKNILKMYDVNIMHSYQVQKLALLMFDQMKKLHNLNDSYRKLLKIGATIHDIGMYVDYYNHHKHGFYLALNSRIYGLNNRELVICAYLVGMHRDKSFKENYKKYNMLIDKEDYKAIKYLSIFIKIAEKFDRSEYSHINNLKVEILDKKVLVGLVSDNNPELETTAALKFKKDFKKLFNKNLVIKRINKAEHIV